jgi:Osmosensitive K+ channel His kinase sensor domain
MARGQHKVFLGMAVGVGKTCRMLQEGHSVAAGGQDVAIGLLEAHGRPETAALAEGLELIPRRHVPFQGTLIEEMDLPAILRSSCNVLGSLFRVGGFADRIRHYEAARIQPERHEQHWDRAAADEHPENTLGRRCLVRLSSGSETTTRSGGEPRDRA